MSKEDTKLYLIANNLGYTIEMSDIKDIVDGGNDGIFTDYDNAIENLVTDDDSWILELSIKAYHLPPQNTKELLIEYKITK